MRVALIAVTEDQITAVVTEFYKRVRADATLGPIFAGVVHSWPEHEGKIAGFWQHALLRQDTYSGNPMMVHMGMHQVQADHFAIWLDHFDQVLHTLLPGDLADRWSHIAHRIGRGMRLGLATRDQKSGPPILA